MSAASISSAVQCPLNDALTADQVRGFLSYDKSTGVFRWARRQGQRGRVGAVAGTVTAGGYVRIRINRQGYSAHRLAWVYVHGEWPRTLLDHRNGIKTDNRIANLRLSTLEMNAQNQFPGRRANKSGYMGVHPCGSRFAAVIVTNGERRRLGRFDRAEEAHEVYMAAKRVLHHQEPVNA